MTPHTLRVVLLKSLFFLIPKVSSIGAFLYTAFAFDTLLPEPLNVKVWIKTGKLRSSHLYLCLLIFPQWFGNYTTV